MAITSIEWVTNTDGTKGKTWNPITGCSKISPGCQNCYAERMANRLRGRYGYPADEPFRVTLHPERLEEPLHWRKPSMVFVPSMGDLFHPEVSRQFITEVFSVIKKATWHIFIILTKRPLLAEAFIYDFWNSRSKWPLPNLWLGVTAENRPMWDERVTILKRIKAAKRIVSYEPALGPLGDVDLTGISWIICGGETGPGARPCHPDWVRSLRNQCQAAGVSFFFKSWGEFHPYMQGCGDVWVGSKEPIDLDEETRLFRVGKKAAGRFLDGRTWDEIPNMEVCLNENQG